MEYGTLYDNGLEIAGSISGLESDGENHIYFPERNQSGLNFNNGVAQGVDDEDAYKGYLNVTYKDFGLLFYKSKRTKTIPTAAWDGAFNDSGMYTTEDVTSVELSYEKSVLENKNGRITARLYHDSYDYDGEYPYFVDETWLSTRINNKDEGNSKQWGAEIRYGMDITDDLTVTAGVEFVDVYESHQKNWDAEPDL